MIKNNNKKMTKTQQNVPHLYVNDVYSKEVLTLSLRQQSSRMSSYWEV